MDLDDSTPRRLFGIAMGISRIRVGIESPANKGASLIREATEELQAPLDRKLVSIKST